MPDARSSRSRSEVEADNAFYRDMFWMLLLILSLPGLFGIALIVTVIVL